MLRTRGCTNNKQLHIYSAKLKQHFITFQQKACSKTNNIVVIEKHVYQETIENEIIQNFQNDL